MILYDIIIAVILGVILLGIVIFTRNLELLEPQSFIGTLFECMFCGFTIYVGLGSIFYSFVSELPLGLTTIVNDKVVAFFGGFAIISITLYWLFRKEINTYREKLLTMSDNSINPELSIDRLNFLYSYLDYKTNTHDPELKLISLRKAGKIFHHFFVQVETSTEVQAHLCRRLKFDLKVKTPMIIQEQRAMVPSIDLAVLKLKSLSNISEFELIKWNNSAEQSENIKKLKKGEIENLQPFLQLKSDYYADKLKFEPIKKIKEGIAKIKTTDSGD